MSRRRTFHRREQSEGPRFTRLVGSVLGAPYLTTDDDFPITPIAGPSNIKRIIEARASSEPPSTPPRPSRRGRSSQRPQPERASTDVRHRSVSPTLSTAGFSIIDSEEAEDSDSYYAYRTPYKFATWGRRGGIRSTPTLNYFSSATVSDRPSPGASIRSLLPKLWDVMVLSPTKGRSSTETWSPSSKRQNFGYNPGEYGAGVDYSDVSPLDEDDGELIDDEACFVAVDFWGVGISSRARVVTGIDILALLPPELSLQIMLHLCSVPRVDGLTAMPWEHNDHPVRTVLTCLSVSKTWGRLAGDNAVWHSLYTWRWGAVKQNMIQRYVSSRGDPPGGTPPMQQRPKSDIQWRPPMDALHEIEGGKITLGSSPEIPTLSSLKSGTTSAPLTLRWKDIFRDRLSLERRWVNSGIPPTPADELDEPPLTASQSEGKWNPQASYLSGHKDSVYCLEFTPEHIITGSRDDTIKVWSQKTGRCLGTFGNSSRDGTQGHNGSVLCLKFFWESAITEASPSSTEEADRSMFPRNMRRGLNKAAQWSPVKGVLYSGSSDCSVIVWDLFTTSRPVSKRRPSAWSGWGTNAEAFEDVPEFEVRAKAKAVLRGHAGGVLDLRVDEKWIVSCSKDATIRVWDRETLQLQRVFRGHDGPVNAVGLEGSHVVSASGDGKMILWDINSGRQLRTFEGHDRGLACVEFKGDLIVSGSSDRKIKLWSARTGACLKTLEGHDALVRALAFDAQTGRLVSASYSGSIRVWDVFSGLTVREFRDVHTSHIFDVKFDDSKIVSTSHDRKIAIMDFTSGLESAPLFG